jgi:hypothetical protein
MDWAEALLVGGGDVFEALEGFVDGLEVVGNLVEAFVGGNGFLWLRGERFGGAPPWFQFLPL